MDRRVLFYAIASILSFSSQQTGECYSIDLNPKFSVFTFVTYCGLARKGVD